MKKFSSISKVAAAAVLGSVIFIGCGSSSSDGVTTTSTTGTAVKDRVVGGIATLYEAVGTTVATTTTDSNGKYTFAGQASTNRFVTVSGGLMKDVNGTITGPNTMVLSAPASVPVANPLTSTMVTINPDGTFDQNASVLAGLLASYGVDSIDLSDPAAILAFVAQDYTGATSENEALQNVGQASMLIANAIVQGADIDALRTQLATIDYNDVNTSDDANLTAALTALSTALNSLPGVDINASQFADNNTSIADLEADLVDSADANALLPLNITGTTTIGGQEVSIVGNTFSTITRDALTSEQNLSSFFDISFNVDMTTLRDRNITDASMIVLVKQTNSADENRSIALEIGGIEIVAVADTNLSDDTTDSTLTITVKDGATISAKAAGLSNIAPVSATLSSGDIALGETNGNIDFNVQTILDAFNSTTINDYLESLNDYARQTDASYKVYVGLDGNFTTGLSDFAETSLENSGLTLTDLNVTAYEGFSGTVIVGDATPINHAPTFTSSDTTAPTMTVGTEVTSCTIAQATDADADTLTYSATGLPAGMTISATTGIISGTPTTETTSGSGEVTVTDGTDTITKTISFMVEAASEPQADISGYTTITHESNNAGIYAGTGGNTGTVKVSTVLADGDTIGTSVVNGIAFTKGNSNGVLATEAGSSDIFVYPNNGYETTGDKIFAVVWDDSTVSTYTVNAGDLSTAQ